MTIKAGSKIEFLPESGTPRKGTVKKVSHSRGLAMVLLEGDPFEVKVGIEQIRSCTPSGNNVSSSAKVRKARTRSPNQGDMTTMTATKMSAKEMRQKAQELGIDGWEDMGRAELADEIAKAEAPEVTETEAAPARKRRTKPKGKSTKAPAKKTATARKAPAKKAAAAKRTASKKSAPAKKTAAKKAPAAKKTAPKSAEPSYTDAPSGVTPPTEAANPFRKGSNLHVAFPILVPRGGKRSTLAERLSKKVELHPYGTGKEINLADFDKRLLLCAQTLRDEHGYSIERKGRGLEGTIKVFIPGSDDDPRKATTKTTRRKTASKK